MGESIRGSELVDLGVAVLLNLVLYGVRGLCVTWDA